MAHLRKHTRQLSANLRQMTHDDNDNDDNGDHDDHDDFASFLMSYKLRDIT